MKTTVVLYRQAAISMSKAPYRWVRAENARCWNKFLYMYTSRFDKTWYFVKQKFLYSKKKSEKSWVFLDLNSK